MCQQCNGLIPEINRAYGYTGKICNCNPSKKIMKIEPGSMLYDYPAPSIGGTKHDNGKAQLDLLSPSWILGVGEVLTFGAKKYASHNWRNGIARSRLLSACLRHIFAYIGGQDIDPETGINHLAHASCNLMFAFEMHHTKPETDDRYKEEVKK